uniref:Phosphoglycerate mutase-like protein AT74 n=1 Tax=Vitis vinifera TaxID=29760 RepID=F6HU11_VITVI
MISHQQHHHSHKPLPKRIILVRHGESAGNLDGTAYTTTPDHQIPLTPQGLVQAKQAGERIRQIVSGLSRDWKVYFYVSPYERTRSTLSEIGRSFSKKRVIGVREECRIREQDFGNFQVEERMKVVKETRLRFGRFFYRFPEGESAADVYDRVSSFLESLWRDIDMNRLHNEPSSDLNFIIVTHGLTSRVFLMKWFKWTVEQFEGLNNLGNCEFQVMQLGNGGEYSLAIHHTEEEMIKWGLSHEMIADQKWRAHAHRGDWNEKCSWYLDSFFENLQESDSSDEEENDELNDCGDHDPDMKEEMKKGRLALLAEELRLQKNVTDDRLERTKELTTEVRKASSQYRKEVEKCSVGIETCEEAREKAEAALVDELKLSALWEERARELGWSHGI